MKSDNDVFSAEAELIGMLVQARFLLGALSRYEREPTGEKWQSVCLAREWLESCCGRADVFRESYIASLSAGRSE